MKLDMEQRRRTGRAAMNNMQSTKRAVPQERLYTRAAKPFVNSLLIAASESDFALANLRGEELRLCLFLLKEIDGFVRNQSAQELEEKVLAQIAAKQRMFDACEDIEKGKRGAVISEPTDIELTTIQVSMRDILATELETAHGVTKARKLAIIKRFRELLDRRFTIQYRAKSGVLFRVTERVFRLTEIQKENTDEAVLFVSVSAAVLLGVPFGSAARPYLLQPDAAEIIARSQSEQQRELREAYVLYIALERRKRKIVDDIKQTGGTHIEYTSVIEKTTIERKRGRAKEHVERIAADIVRNILNSCGLPNLSITIHSDIEIIEVRVIQHDMV